MFASWIRFGENGVFSNSGCRGRPRAARTVCPVRSKNGIVYYEAADGLAPGCLKKLYIDLVVSDIMMPNMTVTSLCAARKGGYNMPCS
jgi:CheY-like chemotaxis protein